MTSPSHHPQGLQLCMCRICCRCSAFLFLFLWCSATPCHSILFLFSVHVHVCVFFFKSAAPVSSNTHHLIFLDSQPLRIFLDDVCFFFPSFCNTLVFFKKSQKTQKFLNPLFFSAPLKLTCIVFYQIAVHSDITFVLPISILHDWLIHPSGFRGFPPLSRIRHPFSSFCFATVSRIFSCHMDLTTWMDNKPALISLFIFLCLFFYVK